MPTGRLTERSQAAALDQLVRAAHAVSSTFHITDYRWFNLRDSISAPPTGGARPIFAFDGLLRADSSAKPAFAAYRGLITRFGVAVPGVRNVTVRR